MRRGWRSCARRWSSGSSFSRRLAFASCANGRSSAEYQFRHALYREVLYRRLKPTPRETFHRRLAEGLEGLRPSVEPEMAAEIALHFEEGCEYERAVKYLLLAAHNASRRYAHAQAIVVLERARELVAKVEPSRRQELDLHVLERIGNAYHALGDIERSVSTYRGLATQAAEAGLLTAIAEALVRRPHALESIPFFERALEIDPTFGAAYVSLSRIYSNLGEAGRAREYARLAYEWRYSVAGDERLSMAYQYHYEVTGDQARATETLEEWKRAFPLDFRPVNSLAVIHNFLGRFKRAIAEGHEAVARNPAHGYPYSNLAHAYRGSGRFAEARQVAEQAVAREVETLPTRRLLYQLAVIAGDAQEAVRHLDWSRDQPREFDMIGARAQVHGWFGRVASARQLYEDTVRMAELRNLPDVGTGHLAWALSMELTYGYVDAARQLARRVLARNPGYDARLRAAIVLAATGGDREVEEAEEIARALAAAHPDHTLINAVLAPIVMASAALGRGQPDAAIEALRPVAHYERGFIAAFAPIHLRGQAYLMLREGRRAAAEFQRILDHRGTDPFSPFHAFAPLGLARAYHLIGDVAASLREYERFFTNWTQGDADVPIVVEARAEYDQLERIASEGAERPQRRAEGAPRFGVRHAGCASPHPHRPPPPRRRAFLLLWGRGPHAPNRPFESGARLRLRGRRPPEARRRRFDGLRIALIERAELLRERVGEDLLAPRFDAIEDRVGRRFGRGLLHLDFARHVGIDRARIDAGDVDLMRRELGAGRLRQRMDRRLRHAVGRDASGSSRGRRPSDVHDRAAGTARERRRERLRHREHADHVGLELVAAGRDPLRVGEVSAELLHDAGVVDQQPDVARRRGGRADLFRIGDVELKRDDPAAGRGDEVLQRVERCARSRRPSRRRAPAARRRGRGRCRDWRR